MKKIYIKTLLLFLLAVLYTQPALVFAHTDYEQSQALQAFEFSKVLERKFKDRENHSIANINNQTNEEVRSALFDWIKTILNEYGIKSDQIVEQQFNNYAGNAADKFYGKNLLITLPGESHKKQIIVGAHYDGSGFGDNGSGVALILSLLVTLSKTSLPYDVTFVLFDAEEVGLVGSQYFVKKMNFFDKNKTLMMINIDSIAFGDYPNIYGGVYNPKENKVEQSEVYELAVKAAQKRNINVLRTKDLDGYYKKHGQGPPIKSNTLYSNPWTQENPAPNREGKGQLYVSPASGGWGDHQSFVEVGIPYLHLEATNWYAFDPELFDEGFDGYYDTNDLTIGNKGRFMNTEFDTLEKLEEHFPNRLVKHFEVYGSLVTEILQHPDGSFKRKIDWFPIISIYGSIVIVFVCLGLVIIARRRKHL
ncbi:M28 family metallopeptidase [Niallia circulans]|uniref:M28 family metallopeptidase n=1 Tax=Niallia circulans TaxID=1397 RepID=UPI0015601F64|nr:M28 family peptidase [Niallia circulans]NRG31604.1 M28 family peptidase [Niallia circulans]